MCYDKELQSQQLDMAAIARKKLTDWAEKEGCPIYRILFVPFFGKALGVYIFYKTDRQLKQYQKKGIVEKAKKEFMRILDEIGYIKQINDKVGFVIDSDEHVQRNYMGNYGLRLTDD